MNQLYWAMAALTVLAALGLARPWRKRSASDADRRRDSNIAAYRQRLEEIEAEVAAGLIQPEAAAALRDEAGTRLLDDASAVAVAPRSAPPLRWRGALLLGLLLAMFSGAYYAAAGSWRTAAMVAGELAPPKADVDAMLAQLEQRLRQAPDDVDGWAALGRARLILQRYAAAAAAYAKANELTDHRDPDLLVNEGEALSMASDRLLRNRPQQLFDQALALDPRHAKALWYAGMAALQAGDKPRTIELWTRLRSQKIPDELRSILDQQFTALGVKPTGETSPAPSSAVALDIHLNLAPELANKLPADGMLIVYAKALEGPAMPLAVVRQPIERFPLRVRLDDSQAMMPTLKLSSFDRWEVSARIGKNGQARAESGDLQGVIRVGRSDIGAAVSLTIDSVVP
ncbi:c-type cytochrome biogenesis protein CcmI [Hydrocarboniphaga effusa]|uniref:c-type cytochrome biogenesis protein CcmI n=1 Tax=Hydrocarboniphaga effusa TaxID=243629 RepID=UPI00398BD6DA